MMWHEISPTGSVIAITPGFKKKDKRIPRRRNVLRPISVPLQSVGYAAAPGILFDVSVDDAVPVARNFHRPNVDGHDILAAKNIDHSMAQWTITNA